MITIKGIKVAKVSFLFTLFIPVTHKSNKKNCDTTKTISRNYKLIKKVL